jgi:hypothetical protein
VLVVLLPAAVAVAFAAPWPHQALRRVALAGGIVWLVMTIPGRIVLIRAPRRPERTASAITRK